MGNESNQNNQNVEQNQNLNNNGNQEQNNLGNGNQGTDQNNLGNNNQNQNQGNQQQQQNTGKTFNQDQVSMMMTREKQQGRNAVYNELGIDPNNKQLVETVKRLVAASKPAENQANGASEETNKWKVQAYKAEAKAEAFIQGIKPECVEDVVALIMVKAMDSDQDIDLKASIGEIKTKYPAFVQEATNTDDKGNQGNNNGGNQQQQNQEQGTGSNLGVNKSTNKDDKKPGSLGSRLAAKKTTKSSYFSQN